VSFVNVMHRLPLLVQLATLVNLVLSLLIFSFVLCASTLLVVASFTSNLTLRLFLSLLSS